MDVGAVDALPGVDDITELTPGQLRFIYQAWVAQQDMLTPDPQ